MIHRPTVLTIVGRKPLYSLVLRPGFGIFAPVVLFFDVLIGE
jgi:hypothetical protein